MKKAKWICEDCSWEGKYEELNRDCNGNEICPDCSSEEVYNENDLIIICPECSKEAKCSQCNKKLEEGDYIFHYNSKLHFCSDDCILEYFKSKGEETYACPI